MADLRYELRVRAFTVIELLTVVGIFALMIAILLPSLGRAREQARRLQVQATIKALSDGLEMFRNDFGFYPESAVGGDAVVDFPGRNPINDGMWGAHHLARAMFGHDALGVDTSGRVLKEGQLAVNQVHMAELRDADRVGVYVEKLKLVPDNDPRWGEGDRHPPSGRPFVVDPAYEYPILYYRASPRAAQAFNAPPAYERGIYELWDNFGLTGIDDDNGPRGFWDFAQTGRPLRCHPLGEFGSIVPERVNLPPPCAGFGKSFVGFFHDPAALQMGVIRPRNAESFALIHSGPDGIWGTDDDVSNLR